MPAAPRPEERGLSEEAEGEAPHAAPLLRARRGSPAPEEEEVQPEGAGPVWRPAAIFRLPRVFTPQPTAEAPMLIMTKSLTKAAAPAAALRLAEPPSAAVARHLAASQGLAIPRPMRQPMETIFGRALGEVRLHTDQAAAQAAEAVGAEAFTVGRRIYFAPGRFQPTPEGAALLGHELTHVLQASSVGPQATALAAKAMAAAPPGAQAAPPRMVRLARESSAEREAEDTEARVKRLFEGQPQPMVLRKAQPEAGAAEAGGLSGLEPHLGMRPAAAEPSLPVARIVQASAEDSAAQAAPEKAVPAGPQASAADVHKLAEQVYRLIKSKLRIERERLGLR